MQYSGTLTKVNKSGEDGYIRRLSVLNQDGTLAQLSTRKDIYIALHNCRFKGFREGMVVSFDLTDDRSRPEAYEAYDVIETEASKLAYWGPSDIELHLASDITTISNPSIPVRWCYTSEMHRRMIEGLKAGNGYAVLLRVHREGKYYDDGFSEVREVKDALQPMSIVHFTKPGTWEVDVILFERKNMENGRSTTNELKTIMRHCLLNKEAVRDRYNDSLPILHEIALEGHSKRTEGNRLKVASHYSSANGVAIATHTVKVEVPDGIFAKPPSPAVKAYANYFRPRAKVTDECDFRGRLLRMIPGFVPYALLELGKRLIQFVASFLALVLLCAKGTPSMMANAFMPAVNFSFSQANELEDSPYTGVQLFGPWDNTYGLFYTPLAIVAHGTLLALAGIILLVLYSAVMAFPVVAMVVGAVLGVYLLVRLLRYVKLPTLTLTKQMVEEKERVWYERTQLKRENRRKQTIDIATRRALVAERQANALICGVVPQKITLTAIPLELQSVKTWFFVAKRAVCRPFA